MAPYRLATGLLKMAKVSTRTARWRTFQGARRNRYRSAAESRALATNAEGKRSNVMENSPAPTALCTVTVSGFRAVEV